MEVVFLARWNGQEKLVIPVSFGSSDIPELLHVRSHKYGLLSGTFHVLYLQPIITQYFIDNKSEIWLLFLIAHSKR